MDNLVSVIVPAYNAGNKMKKCIESVLNQTYNDLELIIVNDGSTDDTELIAKTYVDSEKRIKLFNTENRGVSAARNLAIENATGDYICFVDADDEIVPDAIEKMMNMTIETSADICVGIICACKNKRNAEEKHGYHTGTVIHEEEYLKDNLLWKPYTQSACGKLYKRSICEKVRFETNRRVNEDSYFNFEIALHLPSVVFVESPVYIYYLYEDSTSHKEFSEKFFDIEYFAQRKCEIVFKDYPQYSDFAKNLLVHAYMTLYRKAYFAEKYEIASNYKKKILQYKKFYIPYSRNDKILFIIIRLNFFKLFVIYRNRRSGLIKT